MPKIRPLTLRAIYTLHELALEEGKYRQQIVQILCSHVRSKTNEEAYQETHKEPPLKLAP
jgi:hypothetical protein